MIQSLDLNGTWKARGFDGQHGDPNTYLKPHVEDPSFFDAVVPGDIHLDLMRMGLVEDVNVGINAQKARWVEEQVWVYRRTFDAPEDAIGKTAWLVFEGLDLCAEIFLNGESLGTHANIFYPCRINVTDKLKSGVNHLAVKVESGLYSVSEKTGMGYNIQLDHQLHKRSWLRKPQYQFSWDWAPRLVNVGIYKPVRLEWTDTLRIDSVTVYPDLKQDHSSAILTANVAIDNPSDTDASIKLKFEIAETGQSVELEANAAPGESRHSLKITVDNPKLWWPIPHGEPNLYNTSITLMDSSGAELDSRDRRTGIRRIEIKQNPHPVEGRYFILEVNGKPVFAKGGNWVPADSIYCTVDEDRFRKLVDLAVEANFNALRIWGGGLYADHALLEACDETGVLVWHDFIFACTKYPADDPEFLYNVRKEVRYNVRDLAHHPSLLVWCGNNELEWATWAWGYDKIKAFPDYVLYHHEIPVIVKEEDPSRPYWPSSPYSLDHEFPNSFITGDQHPWHVTLAEDGPNFWAYRTDVSRFPNEGGVLGATGPATLKQFLSEDQRYVFSPQWEFHDNACNYWGDGGIVYRTFETWMGKNVRDVSFDDYVFYSGLVQAEGLQEYSNNFRRRMFSTSSAIFWMYNDSWPATHGWTIVDYYLRKKLSYHPVRRAFAPVHVIPCVEGDQVLIIGVNDTLQDWSGDVRWGVFSLNGGLPKDTSQSVSLAANSGTEIARFPLSDWESLSSDKTGVFAQLLEDGKSVSQNRIFITPFKDLKWADGDIDVRLENGEAVFTSEVFQWGVCLDFDGESDVRDNMFDILPGIEYRIPWDASQPPVIIRVGSKLPW